MSIRIKRGDITLEADTPDEVAFLLDYMGIKPQKMGKVESLTPTPFTEKIANPDRYIQFLKNLKHENQWAILTLLAQSPNEIQTVEIQDKLKLKSKFSVTAIFTSIKRQAGKEGIKPEEVIMQTGKMNDYKYALTAKAKDAVLRAIAEKQFNKNEGGSK